MLANYSLAFAGIWVIIVTVLIQSLVAAKSKASQPGAIPGKMDVTLSHASFVFRSNRTLANSLENLSVMLASAFLAILVGAPALLTGVLIWIIALARIVHMILYYVISTEQNPSPRSYFYLIALLANMVLLAVSGWVIF